MEKAVAESRSLKDLREFLQIANRDERAELEAKVLAGKIRTKDIAERIKAEIEVMTGVVPTEEHRLVYSFDDGLRANILGAENIHKVCTSGSFAKIPALVERKTRYFQAMEPRTDNRDVLEMQDFNTRFTLRHERKIREDYAGPVNDPKAFIRMIHRLSWVTPTREFRIDFSMVKSRNRGERLLDVLKLPVTYELEIEYTPQAEPRRSPEDVSLTFVRLIERLLGAYQGSPFILPESQMSQYATEFQRSDNRFYNLITLERKHLIPTRPGNITKGYTVTNKADGERCGLFVARDRKLLRINKQGVVIWTGVTAKDDSHLNDFVDGEYIPELNLFCIFDVYRFRTQNTKGLPLFTTDEDILANPEGSRLGCARLFVDDVKTQFVQLPSDRPPMRIETKLFLAGDGVRMEESIQRILDMKFEYKIDGLIFTPRFSAVAPVGELQGETWTRVYKWKPASQNSIDFLLRLDDAPPTYDTATRSDVKTGMLFVGRSPSKVVIYPCEQMTGEYIPPVLPADLQRIVTSSTRVPSPFQPNAPRDPDAYKIKVPLNARGVPVDMDGNRVENDTIIECSYDIDKRNWIVMRTRYDKTYKYRVLRKAEFGNDVLTAENVWTSIHVPITDDMIRHFVSNPPDDTYEDDIYYRDDLDSRDRILRQVYSFHNRIKDSLYKANVPAGSTLLELAVGRGGDLKKWKTYRPSKVVGMDYAEQNLTMPQQGACARYLKEKATGEPIPKVLYVVGDMTKPFEEQESKYLNIVLGKEPATTPYLREFEGLKMFDEVACQFALHYACESEETFQAFVNNVAKHCKNTFFGTFLDGQSVYTLLAGKSKHIFRKGTTVFAQFDKQYEDAGTWDNQFGLAINVMLESLEKPQVEYLVPFEKVTEMFQAAGFELVLSEGFGDLYARQNKISFGEQEQEFSFLYKTFVFKRVSKPVEEEIPEDMPALERVEELTGQEEEAPEGKEEVPEEEKKEAEPEVATEEAKTVTTAAPKRRKRVVPKAAEEPPAEPPLFFSGKTPEHKEFSNDYAVEFELEGVRFPSAEHAYQYYKAMTFDDKATAAKILKAKSAQSAKAFGKKVEKYDEKVWDTKKDDVMRSIVRAKFRSNPTIREALLATGDRVLAEADPREKYWSIGTSADTEKAKNPKKWPGQNKLGQLLMDVRTELRAEI
jgi:ribA/ribD-fused uncharacterized protein